MINVYISYISQICVSKFKGSKNVVVSSNYYLNQIDEDCDYNDDDDGKEDNVDGGDIYIMMQVCLSVCLSRKMSTSSWESPVIT